MFSKLRVGPVASGRGRGLCHIDHFYQGNLIVQGLSNFLRRNLVTLNNTLSISHSPRPLAARPKRNAKIVESLLCMIRREIFLEDW